MSVLSWRFRSSSKLTSGEIELSARLSLTIFSSICSGLWALSACAPIRPPNDVFNIGDMSNAQWERLQRECAYEARKAVASQKPGPVRSYDWREIYLSCLELRGARHLGTADQFPSARP